jgi:hypothetical protein
VERDRSAAGRLVPLLALVCGPAANLYSQDAKPMNDSEFAQRFDALAPGAAAKDVAAAFGEPDRKEADVWTYVRPKKLAAGVQQTIYEIHFDGDRATEKKRLPGISMAGIAPVVAAVRADPADKTPVYRIDGKPTTRESFERFRNRLGHWGGMEHWSCAETSGGGITRYEARDWLGRLYQVRMVVDNGQNTNDIDRLRR